MRANQAAVAHSNARASRARVQSELGNLTAYNPNSGSTIKPGEDDGVLQSMVAPPTPSKKKKQMASKKFGSKKSKDLSESQGTLD